MWLVHTLTPVFGTLALLALVAAGVVMMFSPSHGYQLLKNALIALGLFVVGTMLVQASYSFFFPGR
jgi:type IV secretory pathway VirB2 component (pilin)